MKTTELLTRSILLLYPWFRQNRLAQQETLFTSIFKSSGISGGPLHFHYSQKISNFRVPSAHIDEVTKGDRSDSKVPAELMSTQVIKS